MLTFISAFRSVTCNQCGCAARCIFCECKFGNFSARAALIISLYGQIRIKRLDRSIWRNFCVLFYLRRDTRDRRLFIIRLHSAFAVRVNGFCRFGGVFLFVNDIPGLFGKTFGYIRQTRHAPDSRIIGFVRNDIIGNICAVITFKQKLDGESGFSISFGHIVDIKLLEMTFGIVKSFFDGDLRRIGHGNRISVIFRKQILRIAAVLVCHIRHADKLVGESIFFKISQFAGYDPFRHRVGIICPGRKRIIIKIMNKYFSRIGILAIPVIYRIVAEHILLIERAVLRHIFRRGNQHTISNIHRFRFEVFQCLVCTVC